MIKGDTWAVKEALDKKQLEKNIRETKKLLGSPRDVVNAKFLVRETSSLSEFAHRKSTRLNSSHTDISRMPSSA